MKTRFFLIVGLLILLAEHALQASDPFTRVNSGPGAVPNGSSAAAWGDFNNDGWLDVFITSFGGTSFNYCYTNNGDGTFTQVLPTFFPANNINSFGCAFADYDNDGYLDLVKGIYNTFGGNTLLYRNNHNGTFANVTTATIGNIGAGANNVVWGDYDNDGFVDLFLAVSYNATDNVLLHNQGDGTFHRITGNPMVTATGLSAGASWGDYDNDGRLDLVVARSAAGCLFYHNEGGGTFRQITNQAISTDEGGGGVSWGDYDNDGFLDLFIAHIQAPNRLYHNNGDGSFTLLTDSVIYQLAGPSSGGAWADYDNDGWLDLFVANYRGTSFLFHNEGHGTFSSVANTTVTEYGTGQGAAWGDYDNDGFPDLLVPNVFTYNNYFYHNNGNDNAWLTFKLEGRMSNRAAIGAKVRVRAIIAGRERWQLREISGGGSLGSQDDPRPSFGLGDATMADLVRIEWPSGVVQELHDITARQFLTVIEPEARITPAILEVQAGDDAAFRVASTLPGPVEFQWQFNGEALSGETNATFVIAAAQTQHAGKYTVVVSNPDTGFSFNSAPAWLNGPVIITQQPTNQQVRLGATVQFSVTAKGISPVTYQWRLNGVPITDQTNMSLVIASAQAEHVGGYDVVVANSYGPAVSNPAALDLLINPVVTMQPRGQSVVVGGNVTFSVAISGSPAPYTFEWRRASTTLWTNITTEPMSFFVLTNVQPGQAGIYRMVVKNAANFQPGIISGSAALTVLADADGDGLPDEWETAHDMDSTSGADSALDADGDGLTNLQEYVAGTDPQDALDLPRIDAIQCASDGIVSLRFDAMSNKTYTVESSPLAVGAEWSRVADVVAGLANRTVEVNDWAGPAGHAQRYYRLTTPRAP